MSVEEPSLLLLRQVQFMVQRPNVKPPSRTCAAVSRFIFVFTEELFQMSYVGFNRQCRAMGPLLYAVAVEAMSRLKGSGEGGCSLLHGDPLL